MHRCLIIASFTLSTANEFITSLANSDAQAFSSTGKHSLVDLRALQGVTPGAFTNTPVIQRYLASCKDNQLLPSADALISLSVGSKELVLRGTPAHLFSDLDLWAIAGLLEDDDGHWLSTLDVLDLSGCALGPSGLTLVASLLANPKCRLTELILSGQPVGPKGMQELVAVLSKAHSLRQLQLFECQLGDGGGTALLSLLQNNTSLEVINAENNFISFQMCTQLIKAAQKVHVQLSLEGNEVLDEVCNAVSHGIGALLAFVGLYILVRRVQDKPAYYMVSVCLYCGSLIILYLSSTLYHSFFALGRETVHIFRVLDYSGIFILIAGSYSPFLGILFHGEMWAQALLAFIWIIAITGIWTAAFYEGPNQTALRLTLYIGMGWTIVICARPMMKKMGACGMLLLLAGGILYTGGVPFFVRGGHTFGLPDHTIWHFFVLAASISQYLCVYWYVTGDPPPECQDAAHISLLKVENGADDSEDDSGTLQQSEPDFKKRWIEKMNAPLC